MSFLQPLLLLGLPLIALPIVIHLIHQRRFQTVQWAAMAFLLAATKMSKGYARLRQWLILAARTLAVAGLVFAVSRPLSSGWLGMAAGGRVDTTVVLLDRSASMSQVGAGGRTKLESGIKRLQESLGKLESDHYILIDSVGLKPIELSSVEQLADLSEFKGVSATADIPAMLEVVEQYLRDQQPSRTEVWICSDHRVSDWNPGSGRWQSFRDAVLSRTQTVRIHSLAFEEAGTENLQLVGKAARRVETDKGAELLLSFRVQRQDATSQEAIQGKIPNELDGPLPIQFELNGVVTEIELQMVGGMIEVSDYSVPIESTKENGWGRLSLPADINEQDNHFFFTYQKEPTRRTLIVCSDPESVRPLEFASSVTADSASNAEVTLCETEDVVGLESDSFSLVIWHSAIPRQSDPEHVWLRSYRQRGGVILFFPDESTPSDERAFASIRWGDREERVNQVSNWEVERDLLANTLSGESLPVGDLRVERFCKIVGEFTTLASLSDGDALLVKSIDSASPVYFCATTVDPLDSNFASGGVVLFAMVQRAMTQGAKSLGLSRLVDAGTLSFAEQWPADPDSVKEWLPVAGDSDVLSTEFSVTSGVYQSGDRWLAVNRSELEDAPKVISDTELEQLFAGLSFRTVRDEVGVERSLIQEVWRLFLLLMLLMLLAESALSLPRRHTTRGKVISSGLPSSEISVANVFGNEAQRSGSIDNTTSAFRSGTPG